MNEHSLLEIRRKRNKQVLASLGLAPAAGYSGQERVLQDFDLLGDLTGRLQAEQGAGDPERRFQQLLEDRERVSRDLHDGVLQSLYAVGLGLEACKVLMRKTPTKAAERLEQAAVHLEQAIEEVRTFLKTDLGTRCLEEEDLARSLRSLVESMTGALSMPCHLDIEAKAAARIPKEQRSHVLHITREALSNSLRHARARTAGVSLKTKPGGVRLEVWDDGTGFNPRHPPHHGYGLNNLIARAEQLGGRLRITSRPWQGTRVVLELPAK